MVEKFATSRTSPGSKRAVLVDALGTLLWLDPPAGRLCALLGEREGFVLSEAAASRAFAAEIAFYRAHHLAGRDAAGLAELRLHCAEALRDELPGGDSLRLESVRDALLASLRFVAYPDARPALAALRARGLAVVVVSNWDCSLAEVLAGAGLAELVDGVCTSAEAGAAKPDPAVFRAGLALAAVAPGAALHVGDTAAADLAGARAAGIDAALLVRHGEPPPGLAAPAVRSLAELPGLVASAST